MDNLDVWISDPWAINVLVGLAALHPVWRMFRRAGLSPWPALLIVLPLIGFPIVGSVLAFQHWPAVAPRKPKGKS